MMEREFEADRLRNQAKNQKADRIRLAQSAGDGYKTVSSVFDASAVALEYPAPTSSEAAIAMVDQTPSNDFSVMGLPVGAPLVSVKQRWRQLVLLLHPDKHSTALPAVKLKAEAAFKRVGEAYRNLIG